MLKKYLVMIEKQLETQATEKFIVGSSMTIADFAIAALVFNILKNNAGPFGAACSPMLLEYPHFGAYSKRLESELKNHLSTRP